MNVIYIHVCCINNYKDVFRYLMDCIHGSGLYAAVAQIRVCVLGHCDDPHLFNDSKIKLWATSPDLSLYEVFTLNTLYEDCKYADMNVLYLHTKGVTKPGNPNVKSWVEYLCYFSIHKFKECLELLKSNDAVGVNLNLSGHGRVHYAGNFWWTTSAYVRRLAPCVYTFYNSPEWWLAESGIGKYHCMWQSNVNHYDVPYPKHLYA
jgi:hypothetical protein